MSAQVSLFGHFIKYVSSLMLVYLFLKQSEQHFFTQDKKRSLYSLAYKIIWNMRNQDMIGLFANTTEKLHFSKAGNFMAGKAY